VAKQEYEAKYTDPGLREKIKEEIKASDKGGKEGQWSARKSQLLTQEYEKRGGGYKGQSQINLEEWTEEEWQTKEGDARQEDGETKPYLPKEAWETMSEAEKEETEQKKREGSKNGRQYVSNTEGAKRARDNAKRVPIDGYDDLSVGEVEKKIEGLSKDDSRPSGPTKSSTRTAKPSWRRSRSSSRRSSAELRKEHRGAELRARLHGEVEYPRRGEPRKGQAEINHELGGRWPQGQRLR
jgi:hypothetical protein